MKTATQKPILTLSQLVAAAKRFTRESACIKDYRIRTRHDIAMKEIARDLVNRNGGYIIATRRELHERYGRLYCFAPTASDLDRKYIWCIKSCGFSSRDARLSFIAV